MYTAVIVTAPPTSAVTAAWEGVISLLTQGRGSCLGESLKLVQLQVEITLAISVHAVVSKLPSPL